MKKAAIIGVGMTPFGTHWKRDVTSLTTEAINKALDDSGVSDSDVDSLFIGSMSGGLFSNQEHYGSLIPDYAGLHNKPATRVEAACASGGLSIKHAYQEVLSGRSDVVVAMGVEKMSDIGGFSVTRALGTAAHSEWEGLQGATFPGLYAMIAKLHMEKYGTTSEQLAMCSVKSHKNGAHNPLAQFQREITVDQVLNSSPVADPLRLLDCSPVTDGSAAVIIASEEVARKYTDTPIWIKGSGHATDSISLHDREDITTLRASVLASKSAFEQAKMAPKDIGCVEVHDCFSIAEICAIEDMGFCKKGEGGQFTEDGNTAIGGKIPVNTSGGLKSKGHPIGASGVAQAIEAVLQLRGEAGKRNTGAEVAMTHNVGGSGGTAVCHIFGRE